jgi:two-component system, chemotaxis family, response regulator Rcp1
MSNHVDGTAIEILLVEDNPDDVDLTREAFKEGKVRNHLWVAEDGEEALAFLNRTGEFTTAPRPDLILLDLNLPKRPGTEVLAEIKRDPNLKRIPVIILTTSSHERDILQCYDLHANCYITKPMSLGKFLSVIRILDEFWLTIVRRPPK